MKFIEQAKADLRNLREGSLTNIEQNSSGKRQDANLIKVILKVFERVIHEAETKQDDCILGYFYYDIVNRFGRSRSFSHLLLNLGKTYQRVLRRDLDTYQLHFIDSLSFKLEQYRKEVISQGAAYPIVRKLSTVLKQAQKTHDIKELFQACRKALHELYKFNEGRLRLCGAAFWKWRRQVGYELIDFLYEILIKIKIGIIKAPCCVQTDGEGLDLYPGNIKYLGNFVDQILNDLFVYEKGIFRYGEAIGVVRALRKAIKKAEESEDDTELGLLCEKSIKELRQKGEGLELVEKLECTLKRVEEGKIQTYCYKVGFDLDTFEEMMVPSEVSTILEKFSKVMAYGLPAANLGFSIWKKISPVSLAVSGARCVIRYGGMGLKKVTGLGYIERIGDYLSDGLEVINGYIDPVYGVYRISSEILGGLGQQGLKKLWQYSFHESQFIRRHKRLFWNTHDLLSFGLDIGINYASAAYLAPICVKSVSNYTNIQSHDLESGINTENPVSESSVTMNTQQELVEPQPRIRKPNTGFRKYRRMGKRNIKKFEHWLKMVGGDPAYWLVDHYKELERTIKISTKSFKSWLKNWQEYIKEEYDSILEELEQNEDPLELGVQLVTDCIMASSEGISDYSKSIEEVVRQYFNELKINAQLNEVPIDLTQLEPGDILFKRKRKFDISKIKSTGTHALIYTCNVLNKILFGQNICGDSCNIIHAAIYLGDGKIAEANGKGLEILDITEAHDKWDCIRYEGDRASEVQQLAVQRARELVEKRRQDKLAGCAKPFGGYDAWGAFFTVFRINQPISTNPEVEETESSKFYCTNFLVEILQQILSESETVKPIIDREKEILPGELYEQVSVDPSYSLLGQIIC